MATRGMLYRCHFFSFAGPQTEGITARWTKHLQRVTQLTLKLGELVELHVTVDDEPALTPDSKVRSSCLADGVSWHNDVPAGEYTLRLFKR